MEVSERFGEPHRLEQRDERLELHLPHYDRHLPVFGNGQQDAGPVSQECTMVAADVIFAESDSAWMTLTVHSIDLFRKFQNEQSLLNCDGSLSVGGHIRT